MVEKLFIVTIICKFKMTKDYASLDALLKQNPTSSLELYFFNMSGGVNHIRNASIFEPNPHEGSVVDLGAGEDTRRYQGPRRIRGRGIHALKIQARTTLEALSLLEDKCQGQAVKSTASQKSKVEIK